MQRRVCPLAGMTDPNYEAENDVAATTPGAGRTVSGTPGILWERLLVPLSPITRVDGKL